MRKTLVTGKERYQKQLLDQKRMSKIFIYDHIEKTNRLQGAVPLNGRCNWGIMDFISFV